MRKIISVTFALIYLIIFGKCIEASAIENTSIVIDDVTYKISDETPYVIVVPESINVGESESVYIAGAVNGTITLKVPSYITLTEEENQSNKISCSVKMGTENSFALDGKSDFKKATTDIRVDFADKIPIVGKWKGKLTYTLSENITKDVTEYLNFTLSDDGTYYIISSVKNTDILNYCNNNLVLPSEYNGKPVREIGEKLFYAGAGGIMESIAKQKGTIKVTIPSGITDIGKYAFGYFGGSGTEFIIEGETLKNIGDNAFCRSKFSSVNIPNSVSSIGKEAFEYCTNLRKITIPTSLQVLGGWAFNNCTSLSGSIVLPKTLYEMGQNVFASCKNIDSVVWECSTSAIPYGAFNGCSNLNSFIMSDDAMSALTEIKGYAFYKCSALSAFEFPTSLESIANYAFYYSGLKEVTYSNKVKTESKSFPSGCKINLI